MFGKDRKTTETPQLDQLADIERRLEALERRWKEVDVEWSGWFDKYRRLYARIAKREQREAETPEDDPQGTFFPRPGGRPPLQMNPIAQRMLGNGILPRGR